MGRIHQLESDYSIPIHEQRVLNITQWRYITVYEVTNSHHKKGIDVCINAEVYFIYDISLDTFNELNHNNEAAQFKYEYKCNHIACRKCHGKGKIDWVDKVTCSPINPHIARVINGNNYIRDKKGVVSAYKKDWNDSIMFSSTPKLRKGEEFCPRCLGCGITMTPSNKYTETAFP